MLNLKLVLQVVHRQHKKIAPVKSTTSRHHPLIRPSRHASVTAERTLYELRVLQTNRALRAAKLTAEEEAEVPAIASINDLTKQTHSEITAEALDLACRMMNWEAKTVLNRVSRERHAAATENKPALPSRPAQGI